MVERPRRSGSDGRPRSNHREPGGVCASVRRAWKIAAAVAVLALVGLAAYAAATVPDRTTIHSQTANRGDAASITGPVGFHVAVASVTPSAGQVQLQLQFQNTSNQQQRADPADFRLTAAGGWHAAPVFGDGCPNWGRVDLYPKGGGDQPLRDPAGTKAGPTWSGTLCFPQPPSGGALTLVWEPDVAFGPLSDPVLIPLT